MIVRLDKNYTPEVYRESRDFRVFLKLLGIVISVCKSNIDSLPDLYSPDNCPSQLLRYLCSMVGRTYDSDLSVDSNREIIKNYPYMIRLRGSTSGIKLASAVSLNTSTDSNKIYNLDSVIVEYEEETGLIKIYYPYTEELNKKLIEVVRPVGSVISFIPSFISNNNDELDVKVVSRYDSDKYDRPLRVDVDKSQVGLGNTDREE